HLTRLVGFHQARRMYLTGESVSAETLLRQGVITRVVPHESLLPEAQEFARNLAEKSPIAMRLAKEGMLRTAGFPLMEAYRLEQDYTTRLLPFEDAAEARAAFFEKRSPVWKMK